MAKTESTYMRVHKDTLEQLKKRLAEYIGKTGKLMSMPAFLDVLSRVKLKDLPEKDSS